MNYHTASGQLEALISACERFIEASDSLRVSVDEPDSMFPAHRVLRILHADNKLRAAVAEAKEFLS